jgi:hypothetical protein
LAPISLGERAPERIGCKLPVSGRPGLLPPGFVQRSPMRDKARCHEEWLIREQRITIRAMILTLAVRIALFLALVFGITAALTVLGVGLLLTAWLCWSGPNHVGL